MKGEKVIIPMSNSQVAGFAMIDVINADDTKLLLSTVGDRKIFEQGQSSLIFLYWAALLAALITSIRAKPATWLLLMGIITFSPLINLAIIHRPHHPAWHRQKALCQG